MRIIDQSGEIWHSSTFNQKYTQLREGQFVRVRLATLSNHSRGYINTFGMRSYSNILTLPYPCKLAEDMLFDDIAQKSQFEVQQLTKNSILQHPIIISQINDPKLAWAPVTYLSTLLKDKEESKTKGGQVHRVRMSVSGV